jgi:hypothetical protein
MDVHGPSRTCVHRRDGDEDDASGYIVLATRAFKFQRNMSKHVISVPI